VLLSYSSVPFCLLFNCFDLVIDRTWLRCPCDLRLDGEYFGEALHALTDESATFHAVYDELTVSESDSDG
jgi:hypothetical protein